MIHVDILILTGTVLMEDDIMHGDSDVPKRNHGRMIGDRGC